MVRILDTLARAADNVWARVKNNPVVVGWLVGVIVAAAAHFGLDLPPEVVAAVLGVSTGAGAVVARSQVTPV